MSMVLYQFPISHYCEKVRWALDYKGLDWRAENLLPGLHVRRTRQLAKRSSVPVLCEGDQCVQGSAAIISWLDEHYPEKPLTPEDPLLREEALAWESRLDAELGVHVRRFAYHTLLDHPQVVRPFFTHEGRWWWRPFLWASFPKLARLMRKLMGIDVAGAAESQASIEKVLDELAAHYGQHPYLVGNRFSRADLAAASLLAPMLMPPEYGLPWPARMPDPLQQWVDDNIQRMDWVRRLYREHR